MMLQRKSKAGTCISDREKRRRTKSAVNRRLLHILESGQCHLTHPFFPVPDAIHKILRNGKARYALLNRIVFIAASSNTSLGVSPKENGILWLSAFFNI